ncbi:P13 family porin [Borrelia turicatae]|uniref:Borrelia membrane protein P13 n=2 Tax=Borrelia turicatae TaxID=142 RepID=A0A172XAE5_BORTU|nr:P13 family porin [Borrelia turicatae]AAX17379.1 hypothetical protein BT0034 [Borrelia turicatae 91E135]ANF33552.1 hypothetical protein A7978_00170 [Borrelia turicatae]UPA12919.1 P13 family porin [Borrelia turicatae 91E135]UPA14407.1 P13 family porin [Borrelia turicatae]
MKKILILMLVFFCAFVSFAQNHDELVGSGGNVEKMLLYETYKKDAVVPCLLNLFVGFGIGSLVQGDITGGLLSLGFDVVSIGLLSYGTYSIIESHYEKKEKPTVLALSLAAVGGATLVLTRIIEAVLPFTYASSYNRKLQENLGITLGGLQPEVDMNFNEDARLMLEVSFTKRY